MLLLFFNGSGAGPAPDPLVVTGRPVLRSLYAPVLRESYSPELSDLHEPKVTEL